MKSLNAIGHCAESPYEKMDFVWVSSHYDIHLDGLCRHQGTLCRFETWDPFEENPTCRIFRLSLLGKLSWLFQKRMFELFIGRHWTYPDLTRGTRFRMGGPVGKALFHVYYFCKRKRS